MILWLTAKSGYTGGTKAMLIQALARHGVKATDILFKSLHSKVPNLGNHPKKSIPSKVNIDAALHELKQDILGLRPQLIVVNDEATLRAITGVAYTLNQTRGSAYRYQGIPVIVLDKLGSIYTQITAKFILQWDLAKIVRYATGKVKREPNFNFAVARTIEEVLAFVAEGKHAPAIAIDTETAGGFISCVSYTFPDRNNILRTYCVPFFDPWANEGAYWADFESEKKVRIALAELNASDAIKILQNGPYDCAYFIKEAMPLVNYLADTQNLMHSIWCEAPKALHNIASYFVDCYIYWKDDSKGIAEDGTGKTHADLERYWRYNGLDTYYTFLGACELLARLPSFKYAIHNYNVEFSLAVGPCLAASLRGFRPDLARHQQIMHERIKEANKGEIDLKQMTGETEFNLRSPRDVAWFLYDVLGAKKTRLQRKNSKYHERSTDEKVLKLVKEQSNVIINNFIKRLERAKEPATLLSNFGDVRKLFYRGARYLSFHGTSATTTGRFNSGKCQFWTGRNTQNWQPEVKEFLVADPNYVLVEIDWSASDDYFIAHECEDPEKIALLKSGRDTHSHHAAIFFSKDYEEIVKGKKNHESWVIDAIVGVRQIAKKITHGKNFMMQATMMYNLMGREAAVATAKALGHANAARYTDKELIGICAYLCDKYDHPSKGIYKRIRPWQEEVVAQAKANNNLATCAYGMTRKFLGDMDNHATQRELCAFYGQGGTAGNANRSLRKIFYSGLDDGKTVLFLLQVHDSLVFLIHKNHLHKIKEIKAVMEEETEIHGRKFFVPAAPKMGLTWSENMMPWFPEVTYKDVVAFEEKEFKKKYSKTTEDLISELASMNFDEGDLAEFEKSLGEFEHQDESSQDDDELELVE